MAKKCTAILLVLMLALMATGCSTSNQGYYEQAQLYLGSGDFIAAGMIFSQLGEYRDAADYALYCAGLQALRDGELDLARADFELLLPFKSSDRYLTYIEALTLEEEGELEEALRLWEELGSFEDSLDHAELLREDIPADEIAHARALMKAGRYEQAKAILEDLDGYGESADLLDDCNAAILRAAYDRAEALYARGEFSEALTAFEALGSNLDAAQRALDCRSAMYDELEAAYPHATMSNAAALMDGYAEMEDYGDSESRLTDLQARFGVNLALTADASLMPWVIFGQYPMQETGAPAPLTWRLIALDGSTATLLCDSVIDALPATTMPSLMLTAAEQEAVVSLSLPLLSDLTALDSDDLRCAATPYALAQGVRAHSDGSAWWWLGNPVDAGRNAIVWYTGGVLDTGVAAAEPCVGVRPMLRVDLDAVMLTEGEGTVEEPYR
ncbi:MAG: hypothetical protein J1E43_10340 [Christensenellaceae bacterium]|nr:hypothetical protein [Christensenellaceae bacterium]